MKTNIVKLMAKKQADEGKLVTPAIIARATKLSRGTVQKWIKGDLQGLDENTVIALCRFFKCNMSDLIEIDWEGEKLGNAK